MQGEALLALQEASEAFLVTPFEEANLAAIPCSQITIKLKDFDFLKKVSFLFFALNGHWKRKPTK